MNVDPFIEAENASTTGNVKRACELLEVSRAAYYARRTNAPSQRARQDAALTEKIVAIHDESKGTYGAPRVRAELAAHGDRHSRVSTRLADAITARSLPATLVSHACCMDWSRTAISP